MDRSRFCICLWYNTPVEIVNLGTDSRSWGLRTVHNMVIRKTRLSCILLFLILTAFIFFPLTTRVRASSSDNPETVPTDGTYIEGTITPLEENSLSEERLAGLYPFTLSGPGMVQMHFITHTNQSLRIKVMDADESLLLDAWLDTMASPGDYSFYLYPGSYSVCVYVSYADTSGDYRFFLKESPLLMPPDNIVCDQSYQGFFQSSSDDTNQEQHTFRLTASAPISSIECSSDAGLELSVRDLNENVLYSMITDNGRHEEVQLPPGEYLLIVQSYGLAGEYSFCVHTAGSSGQEGTPAAQAAAESTPDSSDTAPAAGSENQDTAVSPASNQPSGTDPSERNHVLVEPVERASKRRGKRQRRRCLEELQLRAFARGVLSVG